MSGTSRLLKANELLESYSKEESCGKASTYVVLPHRMRSAVLDCLSVKSFPLDQESLKSLKLD